MRVPSHTLAPSVRSYTRRFGLLVWMTLALTVFSGATLTVASSLEESDAFCASCHTAPEQTYYRRAQSRANPPGDLSSFHYLPPSRDVTSAAFRCIDCHRGDQALGDRAAALAVGARDVLIFALGKADQGIEKRRASNRGLINDSCVRCHVDSVLVVGFPNHFHNKLPAAYVAWHRGAALILPARNPENYRQQLSKGLELLDVDITCLDCHRAHVSESATGKTPFMNLKTDLYPQCEACHEKILGHQLGLATSG